LILLVEVAGWAGALLILGSYILISTGRLSARSALFQWMNVAGSAGLLLNAGWHRAIPSMALNMVWFAIGLWTLWQIRRVAQ
jgi:hypothetical protein